MARTQALRSLAAGAIVPAAGFALAVAALAGAPRCAHAAEPSVRIVEPADGASLDAMAQHRIVYEVDPGPRGDHVHVYVDEREVGILRHLKGSYTLETLPAGKHELCIKIVNKAHTPTGVQQCRKVVVE